GVDAFDVGVAAWRLGAGRARKEDPVSAAAGVITLVRVGDHVDAGQPLFELHADDDDHLALGRDAIRGAVEVGDAPAAPRALLLDRVGGEGGRTSY
ncbi:MAG: thymidine phosphorylase, partial [Acidimicrobiales bacterium]